MMALGMGASAQISLGSGTTAGILPISTNYGYNYSQQIFTKNEINADAAGNITGVKFYLASASSITNSTTWKVYVGHTTKATFSSTTDWVATSALTQVFDGEVSNVGGEVTVTFPTAFAYNNTDNLIIAVDENKVDYDAGNYFYTYSGVANSTLYYRNDTTNPNPDTPPTASSRVGTKSRITLLGLTPNAVPLCPTVTAPSAAAATGVAVLPTITWSAVSGATGYKLSVGTVAGGTDILNNQDLGNVTSYAFTTALEYNKQYFYTVSSYNGTIPSAACTERSFTTVNIACSAVSLPAANATNTSLSPTITWAAVTGATGYRLTVGTTTGGTDVLNNQDLGNVLTYTFASPLNSATKYFYKVNSYNLTTTSASCSERNFTTLCGTLNAPYTETFSSGSLPLCWSTYSVNNTSYALWQFGAATQDYGTTFNAAGQNNTAGQFAFVDASTPYTGVHDVTLQTPDINLTGITSPFLEFRWFKNHLSTATGTTQPAYDNNSLTVQVKTVSATTWNTVFTSSTNSPIWRTEGITLPASYSGTTIQVRFVVDKDVSGNGYFYDNLLLDDVKLKEAPVCFAPTLPNLVSATANSLTVSWTAPTTAPANGYEIYYSTVNTAPTASTVLTATNSVTSTSLTATIPGLTANTNYFIWVRSACSATEKSDWVGTVNGFTGLCVPTGGALSTSYYLNAISTTGASTNVSYTATSYNAYVDNTATNITSFPGGSFNYSLAAAGGSTYYYYIWADLNNDLDFNDVGETILATTTYSATSAGSVVLPATLAVGSYKIRIGVSYSGAITACGPAPYGNYVDYTLVLSAAPTCLPPTGLATTNVTSSNATLSWTAPATVPGNGYEYAFSSTNTTPTSGTPTSALSVPLSPLNPLTTYYYWVRSVCSGSSTSTWVTGSFTTSATPPANDNCGTPTAITPGATFTQNPVIGTTIGATLTSDATATTACQTTRYADTWYTVVVPASGSITIETKSDAGSPVTDTVLGVYTGSCGTLTSVGCDDDNSTDGLFSLLTLTSANGITAGQTLLVGVWNYSATNNGTFQISAYDASLSTSEVSQVKNNLTAYPNPFADVLNISDVKNVKSVSVVDVAGRLVKTIEKPSSALQLGELKSGMYMVILNMNDGSRQTIKAIKK